MMTHNELMQNIVEVAYLQEELKKRSMIYQVTAKEGIAQLVGLPIDSLYHISYEDYRSVSSLVEIMKDKAYKYYLLNKEEVEAYYKTNKSLSKEGLVMGDIWNYYFVKNPVDLTVIKNSCELAIDLID